MTEIEEKLSILHSHAANVVQLLAIMERTRARGKKEIDNDGEISPETCTTMAALLEQAEVDSLKVYTGMKSVHQTMAEFIPPGASEGNKQWPPVP